MASAALHKYVAVMQAGSRLAIFPVYCLPGTLRSLANASLNGLLRNGVQWLQ